MLTTPPPPSLRSPVAKGKYLVQFDDEEEAAREYDVRIRERGLPHVTRLNFSEPGELSAAEGQVQPERGETRKRFSTSRYRGVFLIAEAGRWKAEIWHLDGSRGGF